MQVSVLLPSLHRPAHGLSFRADNLHLSPWTVRGTGFLWGGLREQGRRRAAGWAGRQGDTEGLLASLSRCLLLPFNPFLSSGKDKACL